MTTVTIEVTLEQAQAIAKGLETYARICIGQFEHVSELVRDATIPMCSVSPRAPRTMATAKVCDDIRLRLHVCKTALGYPPHGSHSIGSHHVDLTARRAWEVKKVLAKALAVARDPSPTFRGVDYDGRILRITTDPDAVVRVTP